MKAYNLEQIESHIRSIAQRVAILRRLGQNAAAKLECIQAPSGPALGQVATCLELQQEFLDEVATEIAIVSQIPGLQLSAAVFGLQPPTKASPR